MSGCGDSCERWPRGDVERYPLLKAQMTEMLAAREAVGNYQPPKAVGEVKYLDPQAVEDECGDFRAALDRKPGAFVEPFMTAPSPGIVAAAMKNEYYDSFDAYLSPVAKPLQIEYNTTLNSRFLFHLHSPH